MRKLGPAVSLLLPLLIAAWACAGRIYLVPSFAPRHAIVVDGDAEDWNGALSYVAKDRLFVGFINDRDDLFIVLTREGDGRPGSARPEGWTVWFDPSGGTRKSFGLRMAPGGPPSPERGEGEGPGGATELEWLGPGGNVLRRFSTEAAAEMGLEVGEGQAGGAHVLEIRIPLRASEGRPFAVGATGGNGIVGVGFFSSRADLTGRPRGPEGIGGRPGGVPGGVGGGAAMGGPEGGMRGALRPNMNPDLSKPVKVWTRVRLLGTNDPAA